MHLEQAKDILFRTHLAALETSERAHGYVQQSGPGVGKTDSIFQYAYRLAVYLGEPVGVCVSMLAEYTSPDIRGFILPVPVPGGRPRTVFLDPPWFPMTDNIFVVQPDGTWHDPRLHGVYQGEVPRVGILFLDEWGQADEDVRKPAASLIHQGCVGTLALPPGWRVVAAQNRPSDRSGVMRELMHIVNRRFLLEIEPDVGCWLNWADDQPAGKQPHAATRAFAMRQPDIVFAATLPDSTDPYCTPRTLCMMDRDIRVLRSEEDIAKDRLPTNGLARELCASVIGKNATTQFFTHLRFVDELPDVQDVIDRPMQAKVPAGKDAQMVCAYMLAVQIDEDTAKPIFRYITRLTREMQILAVGISTGQSEAQMSDRAKSLAQERRAKALVVLPEFDQWLMANKDVMRASQM